MIRFSVVGASGYVGGEILRLASMHPELELVSAVAFSNAGELVTSIHPHLIHLDGVRFASFESANLGEAEVVFLALPHGKSAEVATAIGQDQLLIDAGADFRLESAADWMAFYQTPHAGTWPYGLPELALANGGKQRNNLIDARRIAAPGCNVSAVSLALAPGYAAGLFSRHSSSVLAVGTSGAGRALKSNLLASEVMGSATAYGVAGSHRHNPEIVQNLLKAGASDPQPSFTPILVPMTRGILSVTHVALTAEISSKELREAYAAAYAKDYFIQLLSDGTQPITGSVLGSNFAHISVAVDEKTSIATISVAIDNLVKGTAGAAIQSMNVALGINETLGLTSLGVAP